MNDNTIYNLFMYETNNEEEFKEKLQGIYGIPKNSTLAGDIYQALHIMALELE